MINFETSGNNKGFPLIMVLLLGLSILGGCSSDDKDEAVKTDPTGYYTGSADVKDVVNDDLHIGDLQAMVNGKRFMFMSVVNTLLYDGTITNITGNDFTADVTVYKDGMAASTSNVTGTITEGSQMTGTIAGMDAFNGTFTLVFEQSNSEASALSKVDNAPDEYWRGGIGPTTYQFFGIENDGVVVNYDESSDGVFSGCTITTGSSITPIANSRLYSVTLVFISPCPNDSPDYTGLATTRSDNGTDDVLVFTYADGNVAAYADYTRFTFPPQ